MPEALLSIASQNRQQVIFRLLIQSDELTIYFYQDDYICSNHIFVHIIIASIYGIDH